MIPGCEPAEAPEPPHHHGDVDPQGAGVILDKYKNCEFHEWSGLALMEASTWEKALVP